MKHEEKKLNEEIAFWEGMISRYRNSGDAVFVSRLEQALANAQARLRSVQLSGGNRTGSSDLEKYH